jgi:hypothetical protein
MNMQCVTGALENGAGSALKDAAPNMIAVSMQVSPA